jgi:hypothetical protein
MKLFGFLLITAGFIGSTTVAVLDKEMVVWAHFIPLLLVGVIGVIIVRVITHKHSRGEEKLGTNIEAIKTSLNSVVKKIDQLNSEKEGIGVYDFHGKIDELFVDDLDAFVNARESISHLYGVQNYADLMSHFAAGERYLNRCWSASADGYIDEVLTYVEKAATQFDITLDHFNKLQPA